MAQGDFVRNLAIESWTLYAVGILLIACRMASRQMKLGGWSRLQIEDWLMLFVACTFTADMVAVNEVAKNGSNYMAPEIAAALNPDEIAMAIYGSKMTLALEILTLTTIWLVKACLLILYYRLSVGFIIPYAVVALIAIFCVVGYVLVIVLCLAYWCKPIDEYWRVPVQYSQCATYYNHMIFATAFNISSDLMLLCIPLYIIARSNYPLRRKIILGCVLGLGFLNVLIAILNRYYNFSNPDDLGYVYFYVAEVATAVYVGNIPLCWPLISHIFHAGSWTGFANVEEHSPNRISNRPKHKRPFFSMLPASLWSTRAGSDRETSSADCGDDTASFRRSAGQHQGLELRRNTGQSTRSRGHNDI